MTPEQAERLLEVAREAVQVAESHSLQLRMAPDDVKANLAALRAIIKEIDKGA
ncbi:MAG: hypothetical protein O3B65_06885 [Chloroflexi bacterium]|nr:hypothetical protein [Chloroflexota bacterium]